MREMNKDKLAELHRYDERSRSKLSTSGTAQAAGELGSVAIPQYLRAPYIFYEKCVSELIDSEDQVLELGAGSGLHTWALVKTGAVITATDISPNALKLLEQRIANVWGGG